MSGGVVVNWMNYVLRGAVFAIVFTLVGTLLLSMPLPRVLISGIIAAVLWVILGHYTGLFKKRNQA